MEKLTIAFDVYGTLVDPLAISQHLHSLIGEKSKQFAFVWRQKQLEYTFRRGLMNCYQDFDICTQQAMQYAIENLEVGFTNTEKTKLLNLYVTLPPFADVIPALKTLKQSNNTLVAFSNGVQSTLRTLLSNSKLLDYLEDIISVDELLTFKPDPEVYKHLAAKTETELARCWLVSSNPFDVIGAKSVGLKTAWVKRDTHNIFDPWEYKPDITVKDLIEFTAHLQ